MNLQVTKPPGSHALRLAGDLDLYSVDCAREALLRHLADDGGLELDLGELAACDAAGVQLLLAARRGARSQGKPFSVRVNSPAVARCGELLGLPPETWSAANEVTV